MAGKDAGLMLDDRGFVAELNGSNVFMVKGNTILTPHANACLPGITRATVIKLCNESGIDLRETDVSLSEFMNADAVFATGTMGELTPVVEIDGRTISSENALMRKVIQIFNENIRRFCEKLA